jgi:hypothetical protein
VQSILKQFGFNINLLFFAARCRISNEVIKDISLFSSGNPPNGTPFSTGRRRKTTEKSNEIEYGYFV